ncbi:hypothetical protein DL95DRAFT_391203, partial [Leptodontidium sp. 2 PMI_412]
SLAANEICRFGEVGEWKHGSFNICIPIYINNWSKSPRRRVLLRVPLPYKVGESAYPNNCPDVPIPHLWGFGFPGGQSFMRPGNAPFVTRIVWHLRRAISSFLGSPLHGYLIMDYIESSDAEILSETWTNLGQRQDLRDNLFRDLSRIILSLSQLPLPCIGSWTIDEQGVLTLSNRPLIHQFQSLENEGIATNIARTLTYTAADVYYSDLLACHDNRIRDQLNSIVDEKDGRAQMANLFAMRGLLPHFTSRDLRYGPFVFNLTDLHGSNIFVDCNWHIKYIIDLDRAVDELEGGDELQTFEKAYQDLTDIFEEEERKFSPTHGSATYRTDIMRRGWKIGNFWYFHALKSPKGLFNLFRQHVQPIFEPRRDDSTPHFDEFSRVVSPYWASDAREVVAAKLADKTKYEQKLRELFEEADPVQ